MANVIEKELIQEQKDTVTSSSTTDAGGSNVPMWFPYIPTRKQIESLKIVELKAVCQERGLRKVSERSFIHEHSTPTFKI